MAQRMVLYVPGTAFIEGYGYRISIVKEGKSGHYPTGTWPYHGKPGEQMPWFSGGPEYEGAYERACKDVEERNEKMGISKEDATMIIARSMWMPAF